MVFGSIGWVEVGEDAARIGRVAGIAWLLTDRRKLGREAQIVETEEVAISGESRAGERAVDALYARGNNAEGGVQVYQTVAHRIRKTAQGTRRVGRTQLLLRAHTVVVFLTE